MFLIKWNRSMTEDEYQTALAQYQAENVKDSIQGG